jgi:hypothetical protein
MALKEDSELVASRHALGMEHNATFGLESSGAYLPGESRAHQGLLMKGPGPPMLARFNVQYLIGSTSTFHAAGLAPHLVAELPAMELALARNPSPARPRAYISSRLERIAPGTDWTSSARTEAFAAGELDYVEDPVRPLGSLAGVPGGKARVLSYAPERVVIETETETPGVLVLSDAFDEGWSAEIEGGPALRVLRANFLVRAVEVPAGMHTVVFRYSARRVLSGAAVSLVGLAALGLYLFQGRRRGPRGGEPRPRAGRGLPSTKATAD